MINSAH